MEIWISEYYDREIEFSYGRLRACLWSKIHIPYDRWDITGKSMSYYNAEPILAGRKYIIWVTQKRTLDMNLYWTFPLHMLSIPDELHLFLRVTDKLLQNVIDERFSKEMQLKILMRGQPKERYLTRLVKEINELGSFSIWNKKNAAGSNEFTAFWASRTKKSLILSGLPSKLHEIPCSLRDWLPKKEFKREIRRLLLDILVQESDYIDTPACPSHKKFDWPDN